MVPCLISRPCFRSLQHMADLCYMSSFSAIPNDSGWPCLDHWCGCPSVWLAQLISLMRGWIWTPKTMYHTVSLGTACPAEGFRCLLSPKGDPMADRQPEPAPGLQVSCQLREFAYVHLHCLQMNLDVLILSWSPPLKLDGVYSTQKCLPQY